MLVFSLFFTTAYQNSKVEQTYEMADHNISQHYKINSESKQQSISNSEQNHTSVFAYANNHEQHISYLLYLGKAMR